MNKKRVFVLAAMVSIMLLSACGNQGSQKNTGEHETYRAANGDLQEKTESLEQLPSFLNNQRKEVVLAYQVAAQTTDVLKYIPCYCGCGQSAGHKSNRDCFIKEIGSDGSVIWDNHGSKCGVCIEIAVTSAQMKQQGKKTKEIRTFIDEKYKQGYAKPTLTEMPI